MPSRLLGLPGIRRLRALQLRRLTPLAGGRQRGEPIVRWYWERFLETHRQDIRGHCLEIGSAQTTRAHGGRAITAVDVLDVAERPGVTLTGNLSRGDHLPADTYDCFINQFTMHLIYDVESALYHSLRVLKPGGVLLVNFPCVDYYFPTGLDMGTGRPLYVFWWFTPIQVENLLRRAGLSEADFRVTVHGNLFARVAYQMNMPAEELSGAELRHIDPGHPLLVSVRAVKPADWSVVRPAYRDPWVPALTPARWNAKTGHYAGDR